MRRFVLLVVLCTLSIPVGLSVAGCNVNYGQKFCSGFQSGQQVTATASITLQPFTYGLSLNFGQVATVQTPTAINCKGQPSGLTKFTYGTSNLLLADVSPSGQICGGTWNRNSGNGVPDFTSCIPTDKTGIAYITASGGGATSNPVPIFVHPPVTSVTLGSGNSAVHQCPNNPANGEPSPTTQGVYVLNQCLSQNQTAQLEATVCTGNGPCTPGSSNDITCAAGHLVYTSQNNNIVSIDQNGVATAHQPGSTVISATVAQATSSAGYFFTCPPKNIQLTVGGNGTTNETSVTVNTSNIQPLTATITDTRGNPITGLSLIYSSTTPINIPVNNNGSVVPAFPSDAAIVAQCLPGLCNPAPQNQVGNLSTGLGITSNPVQVHTPGPSSTILYMSSPDSYNFTPVDFQSGTVGTPIRLPYQPNSMVIDETGNFLYFGSTDELMIVSLSLTGGSQLTSQTPGVPGTVLAVAPDDSITLIHDPCRQLFYLYSPGTAKTATSRATGASELSFPAQGPTISCNVDNQPNDPSVEVNPPFSAAFTQDSQTLYIVGGNVLYVYNKFTGWHTCTDNGNNQSSNCPLDALGAAVTVPGVGVFAGGQQTRAFGYCPLGTNNAGQAAGPPPTGVNPNNALNPTNYYPPAETVAVATDQLSATTDGKHIIAATAANGNLTDFDVTIPSGSCPLNAPLQFSSTYNQISMATPDIGSITQVLTSPNSQLAFVTFLPANATGANSTLPAYKIPATGVGQIVNVPLKGQAGAPIGGVFSPDTNTFYTSTNADNLVHIIDTSTLTDTQEINPQLTCGTTTTAPSNPFLACTLGQPVPALFLAAKPRPIQ